MNENEWTCSDENWRHGLAFNATSLLMTVDSSDSFAISHNINNNVVSFCIRTSGNNRSLTKLRLRVAISQANPRSINQCLPLTFGYFKYVLVNDAPKCKESYIGLVKIHTAS